jgi:hypothetical protein
VTYPKYVAYKSRRHPRNSWNIVYVGKHDDEYPEGQNFDGRVTRADAVPTLIGATFSTEVVIDPYEWVLLDASNGCPDVGYGYLWVVESKEAGKQMKAFHRSKKFSTLMGPWQFRNVSPRVLAMKYVKSVSDYRYHYNTHFMHD